MTTAEDKKCDERTFLCERLNVSTGLWEECKLSDVKAGDVFRVFDSASTGMDLKSLLSGKEINLSDSMSAEDADACNNFRSGEPLLARGDAFDEFGGHKVYATIISLKTDYWESEELPIPDQYWGAKLLESLPGAKSL